jgi:hypothetical protein
MIEDTKKLRSSLELFLQAILVQKKATKGGHNHL